MIQRFRKAELRLFKERASTTSIGTNFCDGMMNEMWQHVGGPRLKGKQDWRGRVFSKSIPNTRTSKLLSSSFYLSTQEIRNKYKLYQETDGEQELFRNIKVIVSSQA